MENVHFFEKNSCFIEMSCPFCRDNKISVVYKKPGTRVKCGTCKKIFQIPVALELLGERNVRRTWNIRQWFRPVRRPDRCFIYRIGSTFVTSWQWNTFCTLKTITLVYLNMFYLVLKVIYRDFFWDDSLIPYFKRKEIYYIYFGLALWGWALLFHLFQGCSSSLEKILPAWGVAPLKLGWMVTQKVQQINTFAWTYRFTEILFRHYVWDHLVVIYIYVWDHLVVIYIYARGKYRRTRMLIQLKMMSLDVWYYLTRRRILGHLTIRQYCKKIVLQFIKQSLKFLAHVDVDEDLLDNDGGTDDEYD
jgi:ribosomal protein S27E